MKSSSLYLLIAFSLASKTSGKLNSYMLFALINETRNLSCYIIWPTNHKPALVYPEINVTASPEGHVKVPQDVNMTNISDVLQETIMTFRPVMMTTIALAFEKENVEKRQDASMTHMMAAFQARKTKVVTALMKITSYKS